MPLHLGIMLKYYRFFNIKVIAMQSYSNEQKKNGKP